LTQGQNKTKTTYDIAAGWFHVLVCGKSCKTVFEHEYP